MRQSTQITPPVNLRAASREAERRYVACLWFNAEAVDAACDAELRGRDFYFSGHSAAFAYLCKKREHGKRPDLDEFARLANEAGVGCTADDLFHVIIEHKKDADPMELARAVKAIARQRSDEDCRAVTVDALRDGFIEDFIRWRRERRARREAPRPYHHV